MNTPDITAIKAKLISTTDIKAVQYLNKVDTIIKHIRGRTAGARIETEQHGRAKHIIITRGVNLYEFETLAS